MLCTQRQGGDYDKDYLDFLWKAYAWFLEGDDDAYEKMTQDFENARDENRVRSEQRAAELREACDRLRQQKRDVSCGNAHFILCFVDMCSSLVGGYHNRNLAAYRWRIAGFVLLYLSCHAIEEFSEKFPA